MAASQPLVAAQALSAHDFARHRCLMDVGGGEGAFLEAVGARHPELQRMLFDLPVVADRARARLGANVRVIGGDFRTDPLPQGADAISLVRILHDHEDAVAAVLLARVFAALPGGGTLIICEPMAGTPSAPAVATYFAFYLRAMGSGRPRTAEAIAAMCRAAGFTRVRERPTPLPLAARVLVARKP
jgi:demethylspheroidene O-methyltransferase